MHEREGGGVGHQTVKTKIRRLIIHACGTVYTGSMEAEQDAEINPFSQQHIKMPHRASVRAVSGRSKRVSVSGFHDAVLKGRTIITPLLDC